MARAIISFGHLSRFTLRAPWWKKQQDYAAVKRSEDEETMDTAEPVYHPNMLRRVALGHIDKSTRMIKFIFFSFVMLLVLAFVVMFISQLVFASNQPAQNNVQKSKMNTASPSPQTMHPTSSYGHAIYDGHLHPPAAKGMRSILKSPCGTNATSARAAGCHFDIISFAWLHHKCYDAELSKSFSSIHEWEWFLQPNREQPVLASEALSGNYPVLYVNWEYHVRHCTYMWKKMHRAILKENGLETIDWYIAPYEHTEHCAEMLLSRGKHIEFDVINTGIRVKYPDCGIAPER
ncbi:hypothetical protein CPC735_057550 [Coccidioides posadasii C735 delta SOWgp]|uniref:Uncharacterized protein n=1 Tax=Coccidioides posadasii (strain C735) TaxID=222929 RepID=C5PIN2_COCP7|nr:hypothetical protein CPC735_057550 [Coccidioides posadasii C735 delta SOWgp]EER24385.1 hypothetical protein CPC735_057550 [Coccidioides posadasii C735 delta SOWgp]|eukprot:XP_003066530.1 hypothetical protein CPC735_057550 [Coccidioides posadasii C735 delta SOWgp]